MNIRYIYNRIETNFPDNDTRFYSAYVTCVDDLQHVVFAVEIASKSKTIQFHAQSKEERKKNNAGK